MVPRANHQENKRSRVDKSEFVPQNEGNNCMICKEWSLALRCKVKFKKKSKNIVIRKNNVAMILKKTVMRNKLPVLLFKLFFIAPFYF